MFPTGAQKAILDAVLLHHHWQATNPFRIGVQAIAAATPTKQEDQPPFDPDEEEEDEKKKDEKKDKEEEEGNG
jgi:hypothetical protein